VPVLGGIFMFREKLALNQMAGLALVLAGLVALGLTS
jgi:multidrug transporter EmrE-like cation transporter